MRQSGSPAERPFYWLALAVLVVFVLWVASDILVPIALAVLIWFLVNALAKSIARVPGLANLPNRLIAALILTVILLLAGSILSQSIGELARDAAERQRTLLDRVTELASTLGLEDMLAPDRIREILRPEEWLGTVLATAQGFISNISLIFLYAVFLLVDERYYEAKIRALVPNEARRADLMETFASIGETTRLYLWLMTLISAGVGLITFAVCAGVGLGGAAFWGFMAFALNFVPTIGSILAVLLPALYALATLADPALLAVLVAALAATQFVAGGDRRPAAHGQPAQPLLLRDPALADRVRRRLGTCGDVPGNPDHRDPGADRRQVPSHAPHRHSALQGRIAAGDARPDPRRGMRALRLRQSTLQTSRVTELP